MCEPACPAARQAKESKRNGRKGRDEQKEGEKQPLITAQHSTAQDSRLEAAVGGLVFRTNFDSGNLARVQAAGGMRAGL
jgi:hypothetical protein